MIKQHYVEFFSPGRYKAETTMREIDSWDVDKAVEMSKTIVEKRDARPYGFHFITRGRKDFELDSKELDRSPKYYLGGTLRTVAELEAENDPMNRLIIKQMKSNKFDKVIINTNCWKWGVSLLVFPDDIILDV